MRRILHTMLVCMLLLTTLLALPSQASPLASSAGERELALASSPVKIRLHGNATYQVSLDGTTFSRELPQQTTIKLRYRSFDPLDQAAVAAVPAQLKAKAPQTYIIQFVTEPLDRYRQEIEAAGGRVFHYLPDQAYLVQLNENARGQLAQQPHVRWIGAYEPAYKLEEQLSAALSGDGQLDTQRYSIMVLEKGPRMQNVVAARIRSMGGSVDASAPEGYRLEATLTGSQLLQLAQLDEILFIDRWAAPEYDMNLARQISGADFLQTVGGYTGQGVRGEVMDGGLRTTHQDFRARPPIVRSNSTSTSHGTSTYGQIFGSGAGDSTARGLLPSGQGIFSTQISGSSRYAHTASLVNPSGTYRAVFQSNSWGSGLTTNYTTVSAEMDDILFDHDILILQSQSNDGTRNSRPQAWAKNILSVGGVRHRNTLSKTDDAWAGGASIGPASDGRIKPDLTHFYDNIRTTSSGSDTAYTSSFGGTSGATPITAGYAGLLFQMWADGVFAGGPGQARDVFTSRPHMTTAKALMINSASQYPFSGTTADLTRVHQGWGMVDLKGLHDTARINGWQLPVLVNETAILQPLQTHTYNVNVSGSTPLKATLVYADPMGSPSATQHRVNDLTLRVTSPSGTVYWGNNGLLSGNWSTAGGSPNRIDTVENVFIQSATPGTWRIEVLGDAIVRDGHVQTAALDADYALVVTKQDGSTVTPTRTPTGPTATRTRTATGPTSTRTRTRTSTAIGPSPTRTRTSTSGTGTYPAWSSGVSYAVGTRVSYAGANYQCLQAHTSQVGWEPPNVASLWQRI